MEALRSSGAEESTLVVFAAVHGEEFGEHGQILHGNNLGRAVLEVPLVIRLPRGAPVRLAVQDGERPSILRIWATILELAGGHPSPALPPSLFRVKEEGALSELLQQGGRRQISLVQGDVQLIRELTPTSEKDLPFSGSEGRSSLWGWGGRGARQLHSEDLKTRFEERLQREWSRFLDRERSLEEESRIWSEG